MGRGCERGVAKKRTFIWMLLLLDDDDHDDHVDHHDDCKENEGDRVPHGIPGA